MRVHVPRFVTVQDVEIARDNARLVLPGSNVEARLLGAKHSTYVRTDTTPQVEVTGQTVVARLSGTSTATFEIVQGTYSARIVPPKLALSGTGPEVRLSGTDAQISIEDTSGTAYLKVIASQKIGIVNWSGTPYVLVARAGDLVPVFVAKSIPEKALTAPAELDRTFILAKSIPPNMSLMLYLTVDMYNNAGATSCVRAYFSDATVTLCTTSTSYVTLTGSAYVNTLANGWMILEVSTVASGTAYVKNACALLVPVAQ